jgi:hypothetical protein
MLSRLISCFLLASALASYAQSPESTLVGIVRDATGARVPGATVTLKSSSSELERSTVSNNLGEYRVDCLPPGRYHVNATAFGFQDAAIEVLLSGAVPQTLVIPLDISGNKTRVDVHAPVDSSSSVIKTVVLSQDIDAIPLAHRSFANIAYFAPMTEPVEPSDPTKARITAVSFAGSSGLNVDLSIDGGDNNDDYIGGFLQNISPEAIQEFTVRTAQFDADTSRTNGGSVVITTRRGTDNWHGSLAGLRAKTPLLLWAGSLSSTSSGSFPHGSMFLKTQVSPTAPRALMSFMLCVSLLR